MWSLQFVKAPMTTFWFNRKLVNQETYIPIPTNQLIIRTFHETLMLIQNQEALQNKSRFAFCGQFEKVEKNKRKRKTWKGEN